MSACHCLISEDETGKEMWTSPHQAACVCVCFKKLVTVEIPRSWPDLVVSEVTWREIGRRTANKGLPAGGQVPAGHVAMSQTFWDGGAQGSQSDLNWKSTAKRDTEVTETIFFFQRCLWSEMLVLPQTNNNKDRSNSVTSFYWTLTLPGNILIPLHAFFLFNLYHSSWSTTIIPILQREDWGPERIVYSSVQN